MKLFTLASLVTLTLLISKILGLLSISWLTVFVPVLISLGIGLFFFIIAVIVAVAAKVGR